MNEEDIEEPLTDEQLCQVFCFEVENSEAISKQFLPERKSFKIDRHVAVAAAEFIRKHKWTPVSSPDEIPDGRHWTTWKNGNVDDLIIARHRYTEEGFREIFGEIVAYMPYIEPEPYQATMRFRSQISNLK